MPANPVLPTGFTGVRRRSTRPYRSFIFHVHVCKKLVLTRIESCPLILNVLLLLIYLFVFSQYANTSSDKDDVILLRVGCIFLFYSNAATFRTIPEFSFEQPFGGGVRVFDRTYFIMSVPTAAADDKKKLYSKVVKKKQ